MKILLNRYLTHEDFEYAQTRRDEQDFVSKYPHRDLWTKPDAIMKWFSIIRTFETLIPENGKKVVDLGSGEAPVCHFISNLGNTVTAVDIKDINHLVKQSIVKMVLKNAWYFLDEQEDESVDVFLDSCAVTHFETDKKFSDHWDNAFEKVYRCLKPGGYFIISSDVYPKNSEKTYLNHMGEFWDPQDIITAAIKSGLKVVGDVDFNDTDPYVPDRAPYPVSHLVFVK